ncbi:MAG: hypothetical protein IKS20_03080 [Victivallales bacterium]|nr:hypothetical protein [Victivallales bacterium]
MGLKCPKCGVDNLLTAIFCRGCGEKLDLNEMKPDDVLNDEHTKSQRKGASKAQKTFVGVFFGLLGIIVLLAMCPVGAKGTAEGEVDKALETGFTLLNKVKVAPAPAPGKGKKPGAKKGASKAKALPTLDISSDDASKLMSKAMGLPKDQWPQGPLVPKHFSVDFKAGNSFKIVVKTKAFGFLPVSCTANAKIQEAEGQGTKYDYVLGSPRLGMLPLFVYGDLSLGLIQNLMNSVPAFQTIKTASEITTSDGKITVKF